MEDVHQRHALQQGPPVGNGAAENDGAKQAGSSHPRRLIRGHVQAALGDQLKPRPWGRPQSRFFLGIGEVARKIVQCLRQRRTETVHVPRLDEAPSGFACLRGHLQAGDVEGLPFSPHASWSRELLVLARRMNVPCLMIQSSLMFPCTTHAIRDSCAFGSRCHVRLHLHVAQMHNRLLPDRRCHGRRCCEVTHLPHARTPPCWQLPNRFASFAAHVLQSAATQHITSAKWALFNGCSRVTA